MSEELLREELKDWTDLCEKADANSGELKSSIESEFRDFGSLKAKLEEIVSETGPALQETLSRASGDLRSEFQSAIEDVALRQERFKTALEELNEIFSERVPETMDIARERLVASCEAAKEFVQNDFIEKIIEVTGNQLEKSEEKLEEAAKKLLSDFDGLVEETTEQAEELLEHVQQIGANWTGKVEEIKEEYESIVTRVNDVGREVQTLMDLMDDSLATTGVGMSAASSVLSDVKNVLDSVV